MWNSFPESAISYLWISETGAWVKEIFSTHFFCPALALSPRKEFSLFGAHACGQRTRNFDVWRAKQLETGFSNITESLIFSMKTPPRSSSSRTHASNWCARDAAAAMPRGWESRKFVWITLASECLKKILRPPLANNWSQASPNARTVEFKWRN